MTSCGSMMSMGVRREGKRPQMQFQADCFGVRQHLTWASVKASSERSSALRIQTVMMRRSGQGHRGYCVQPRRMEVQFSICVSLVTGSHLRARWA